MSARSSSSKAESVSVNSINLDAVSTTSADQIDEALRQSVLAILAHPEQLAALSDEDRERVQRLAMVTPFWPNGRLVEELRAEEAAAGSAVPPELRDAEVTDYENVARTMLLLYGEMGDTMLAALPGSELFQVIRSIAKLVGGGEAATSGRDEKWNDTMELLNCSSADNLIVRLKAWPLCHQLLVTSVGTSEYHDLFADALEKLSDRFSGDEAHTVTGEYKLGRCDLCCSASDALLWSSGCCDTSVCVVCLHHWLMGRLTEIHMELACPGCAAGLTLRDVRHLLSEAAVTRRLNLLDRHRDGNRERDCPRCSCLSQRPVKEKRKLHRGFKKIEKEQGGMLVKCRQCDFLWCFDCHSPIHPGLTCRQHRSGAPQLESWAKKTEDSGLRKAQRCPRCKVLIEKNDGCNHMTCGNCRHEFCYICRKKWNVHEVRVPYFGWSVFGSHSSRLSVFGCSRNFMAERPALRRFIRGTLFVLRACGLVVVPTVAVAVLLPFALALVCAAIPLAPFIIPAVLIYLKLRK